MTLHDANVEQYQLEWIPLWRQAPDTAETQVLRKWMMRRSGDWWWRFRTCSAKWSCCARSTICRIARLPLLSAPFVTVMSRLARGCAMPCEAWLKAGHYDEQKKEPRGESEKQLELFYEEAHVDTAAGTRSYCT